MRKSIRIGVDLMGNDNSPTDLLRALEALPLPAQVELVLIGLCEGNAHVESPQIKFHPAPTFIGMEDSPLAALRSKKEASLLVGLRLVKEGHLDALVSAGNTGALISASKMILGMFPPILRPALLAKIPTKKEPVVVLDVGANVQLKTTHLIQFAQLGAAYCRTQGIQNPKVGLLNIGSEAMKGTSAHQEAYAALKKWAEPPFEFAGNVEGKSVFDGDVDVLITDGFTGNVFLKTAEGIASLILDRFGTLLPPTEYKKLGPQIKDLQRNLHYAEYPGAILLGVKGLVLKCHGYSTPQAFNNGILEAIRLSEKGFLKALVKEVSHAL